MCLSWGISFHWPRNRDIQDEMVYATTMANTCLATPRESQCATQVKPCWTGLETVYR